MYTDAYDTVTVKIAEKCPPRFATLVEGNFLVFRLGT